MMFEDQYGEPRYRCFCSTCKEMKDTNDDVEFLDIAEDFDGRDLMTFRCRACGEVQQSNVWRR